MSEREREREGEKGTCRKGRREGERELTLDVVIFSTSKA